MKNKINSQHTKLTDVLLVKPNSNIANAVPPLGLGYLATALMKHGLSVMIKDCRKDTATVDDVVNLALRTKAKIVGITVCTNEASWTKQCTKQLREKTTTTIVVGGPHPTGLKEKIFADMPDIDYACYSEGEETLPLLTKNIIENRISHETLQRIPNLMWRAETIIINSLKLNENLDDLGYPAYELMDPRTYPQRPHGGFSKAFPIAPIVISRGCPYNCTFCAAHLMQGCKVRYHSVEKVLEEIELLSTRYNVRELHIEDDNFTVNKEFVMRLCEGIIQSGKKLLFSLPNGIRLDRIDEEMLSIMHKAGFYSMALGIESGSQRILDAMRKHLDLTLIREKTALIKKFGFTVKGFFMIGYPGETKQDIESTINLAKNLNIDIASFSIFIPLPGTIPYNDSVAKGELTTENVNWSNFYTGKLTDIPYSPPGISKSELKKYITKAMRTFYLRPKTAIKIILSVRSLEQVKFLLLRFKGWVLRI
jgi:radical SAM superfamily enzyme YgiQ (UPF0313 family)